MGELVTIPRHGGLTRRDPRRLALFVKTVGKDLVGTEIDEAIEMCEVYGANPFVRDIYFFAFGKPGTDKRKVVPVLGVGLYRKIAARGGNYRPDDAPARFGYDETAKSATNPTGMLWCEVSCYRHAHGEWHKITSRLKWEERAPLKEVWENDKPTGRFVLDPKKGNWRTMPETMMAKCVEVDAIRKGWPNETAGSYIAEEMDAAHTIELTATEIVAEREKQDRFARIGGQAAILIDWCDGQPLQRVAIGKLGDAALAYIKQHADEPAAVTLWEQKNRVGLQEYWAHDKAGAFAVRQALEASRQSLQAAE